jgi:hypothetical protein
LEDKIQSETKGGGFDMNITRGLGPRFPSISIVDKEKDKRQDTNATAINTEFVVAGEKRSSEDLGFNTDLEKAQVITGDEEHNFSATLPTDLLNQEDRQELKDGLKAIGEAARALTNPTGNGFIDSYKNIVVSHDLNDHFKNDTRLHEILEGKYSEEDKLKAVNDSFQAFLKSKGYTGPMPIVLLDENNTYAVDSGKKIKIGEDVVEIIAISRADLNSAGVLKKFGHEYGHLSTKDKDEATANFFEKAITTEINKMTGSTVHQGYLDSISPAGMLEVNDANELIARIPEEAKEKLTIVTQSGEFIEVGMNMTKTIDAALIFNTKEKKAYYVLSESYTGGFAISAQAGAILAQTMVLHNISTVEDYLSFEARSTGGSISLGTALGFALKKIPYLNKISNLKIFKYTSFGADLISDVNKGTVEGYSISFGSSYGPLPASFHILTSKSVPINNLIKPLYLSEDDWKLVIELENSKLNPLNYLQVEKLKKRVYDLNFKTPVQSGK